MADYPTSAATDASLYIAVDNKETSLTAGIDAVVTTLPVVSTTGFPTVGFVSVDTEIISYTGTTATSFTGCVRGASGTTAASHASAATVSHNIVAAHHNALKEEVKAIEADLVPVQSALSDLAPASTSTGILGRIRQIVTQIKNITGMTNWYDTFTSFPVSKGGTGNTSLSSGAYLKGNGTSAITTQATPIPVADGGTNSSTSLNNNRVIQSSSGSIVESAAITAARALISDANGIPTHSSVTSTELGLLSGQVAIGKIRNLQIGTTTTVASTTSTSFTNTGLSVSLTPLATSSTVRIMAFITGSTDGRSFFTIANGTTNLLATDGGAQITVSGDTSISLFAVDSPASTSAQTYNLRYKSNLGSTTTTFGPGGGTTVTMTLVAFEVLA